MAKKKPSFEEALQSLETIVEQIESGQIGLEESIKKYAEGIELIKHCRAVLDSAETKIRLLTDAGEGELAEAGDLAESDDSDETTD